MIPRIRTLSAAMAAVLTIGAASPTASVAQLRNEPDAASVIRAAYGRYNASWYRSLTFVQQTYQYGPQGTIDTALWYEAYAAPGRLRIDIAPLEDRTMYLFANDSQYVFRRDTLVSARRLIHPLLLLGFDLYFLPPDETLRKLTELGFDVNIVRADVWLGRPVVVIGAHEGDTTSAQCWLDAERLVFVRLLMPSGGRHQEVHFNRYEQLAGGWIAPEVVAFVDGRIVLRELYAEISSGATFDQAFFNPAMWRSAPHWRPERSR